MGFIAFTRETLLTVTQANKKRCYTFKEDFKGKANFSLNDSAKIFNICTELFLEW